MYLIEVSPWSKKNYRREILINIPSFALQERNSLPKKRRKTYPAILNTNIPQDRMPKTTKPAFKVEDASQWKEVAKLLRNITTREGTYPILGTGVVCVHADQVVFSFNRTQLKKEEKEFSPPKEPEGPVQRILKDLYPDIPKPMKFNPAEEPTNGSWSQGLKQLDEEIHQVNTKRPKYGKYLDIDLHYILGKYLWKIGRTMSGKTNGKKLTPEEVENVRTFAAPHLKTNVERRLNKAFKIYQLIKNCGRDKVALFHHTSSTSILQLQDHEFKRVLREVKRKGEAQLAKDLQEFCEPQIKEEAGEMSVEELEKLLSSDVCVDVQEDLTFLGGNPVV